MLQSFIDIFKKITNLRIILFFILIFLFVSFFPFKPIPDFLNLSRLPNKKDILFRLLTTTIGFSGLILTVLLVVYNFYLKSVRRNTLNFITDSIWFKAIFSLFFGNTLFLSLGFLFTETSPHVNDTTLLYVSYCSTILFILSLLPMAILSLNDSLSIQKIDRLLKNITEPDLRQLHQSSYTTEMDLIHLIENNPVLILRDLSVNAMTDKDWVLPQTVLSKLYAKLIATLEKNTDDYIFQRNISVWLIFCHSLKNNVVRSGDNTTATALLRSNLEAHRHFAQKRIILIRGNGIDVFLKDYMRLIIENNLLVELQPHLLRFMTQLVSNHFDTLDYADTELPTKNYKWSLPLDNPPIAYNPTALENYWFYLTHELPDLVFSTIRYAIDDNRKTVFQYFGWQIHYLIDSIADNEKMTTSQKDEALEQLWYSADQVSEYAIDHNIFEVVDIVSHLQIEKWLQTAPDLGRRALYQFSRMIKRLFKKKTLSSLYIDQFFMIARVISHHSVDEKILSDTISTILDDALTILNDTRCEPDNKNDFQYELQWFYDDYLTKDHKLANLRAKYDEALKKALEGYERPRWT